eukprot:GDKJ01061294.1.p1 GENE.GDKJ01061294.1~~GDKJ01061294.1.p1  ORF type:complete len:853 (+),score=304.75 GDKJ01061294.1:806-3364(+)
MNNNNSNLMHMINTPSSNNALPANSSSKNSLHSSPLAQQQLKTKVSCSNVTAVSPPSPDRFSFSHPIFINNSNLRHDPYFPHAFPALSPSVESMSPDILSPSLPSSTAASSYPVTHMQHNQSYVSNYGSANRVSSHAEGISSSTSSPSLLFSPLHQPTSTSSVPTTASHAFFLHTPPLAPSLSTATGGSYFAHPQPAAVNIKSNNHVNQPSVDDFRVFSFPSTPSAVGKQTQPQQQQHAEWGQLQNASEKVYFQLHQSSQHTLPTALSNSSTPSYVSQFRQQQQLQQHSQSYSCATTPHVVAASSTFNSSDCTPPKNKNPANSVMYSVSTTSHSPLVCSATSLTKSSNKKSNIPSTSNDNNMAIPLQQKEQHDLNRIHQDNSETFHNFSINFSSANQSNNNSHRVHLPFQSPYQQPHHHQQMFNSFFNPNNNSNNINNFCHNNNQSQYSTPSLLSPGSPFTRDAQPFVISTSTLHQLNKVLNTVNSNNDVINGNNHISTPSSSANPLFSDTTTTAENNAFQSVCNQPSSKEDFHHGSLLPRAPSSFLDDEEQSDFSLMSNKHNMSNRKNTPHPSINEEDNFQSTRPKPYSSNALVQQQRIVYQQQQAPQQHTQQHLLSDINNNRLSNESITNNNNKGYQTDVKLPSHSNANVKNFLPQPATSNNNTSSSSVVTVHGSTSPVFNSLSSASLPSVGLSAESTHPPLPIQQSEYASSNNSIFNNSNNNNHNHNNRIALHNVIQQQNSVQSAVIQGGSHIGDSAALAHLQQQQNVYFPPPEIQQKQQFVHHHQQQQYHQQKSCFNNHIFHSNHQQHQIPFFISCEDEGDHLQGDANSHSPFESPFVSNQYSNHHQK